MMENSHDNTVSKFTHKLSIFHLLMNILKLTLGFGVLIGFSFIEKDIVSLIQIWAIIFLSSQMLMRYFEQKNNLHERFRKKINAIIINIYVLSVGFEIASIEAIYYFLGSLSSIMMILFSFYDLAFETSQILNIFQHRSSKKNSIMDMTEQQITDIEKTTYQ